MMKFFSSEADHIFKDYNLIIKFLFIINRLTKTILVGIN